MSRTDTPTLIAELRTLARGGSIAVEAADRLEELTTWRPIETAPLNERVLLLDGHDQHVIGQQTAFGWFIDGHVLPVTPTHWMPLPDAPTASEGGEG